MKYVKATLNQDGTIGLVLERKDGQEVLLDDIDPDFLSELSGLIFELSRVAKMTTTVKTPVEGAPRPVVFEGRPE